MEVIFKYFPFLLKFQNTSEQKKISENNKEILRDILEVKKQLEAVESKYNLFSDADLVESLIFEERALKAKYAYLLRLAKTKGVSNEKITELT